MNRKQRAAATGRRIRQTGVDVKEVRAAFVLRGTTLHGWCRQNGLSSNYVQMAIRGQRGGQKAGRILSLVKRELGL